MRFKRGDRTMTGRFARRDATFYASPNTTSAKRMHALQSDGGAACGPIPLNADYAKKANGVSPHSICERPACYNEWRRLSDQRGYR